jgi:hypothetical protein
MIILLIPILQTFPFKEISPVIDILDGIGCFEAKLIKAVHIAVPADGPSFGIAPSIKWIWIFFIYIVLISSSDKYFTALILANFRDSYITFF